MIEQWATVAPAHLTAFYALDHLGRRSALVVIEMLGWVMLDMEVTGTWRNGNDNVADDH